MTEVLKVLKHYVTNASLREITVCSLSTWLLNPHGKIPTEVSLLSVISLYLIFCLPHGSRLEAMCPVLSTPFA